MYIKAKGKPLPKNRPSVNTSEDLRMSVYAEGKMNFEYFMNREYAFNRDKGKCKCCKVPLFDNPDRQCHHADNKLPIEKINKVPNLAWVCKTCHRMIHNSPIPENLDVDYFENLVQKAGKIVKRQICYTIILPKQEAEYFIPGENKLLVWTK